MTPEEKRAKRNAYARAYYAANKDRMKAGSRRKAAKAPGAREKAEAEKLAVKGGKAMAAALDVVKKAADVLAAAYKSKDEALVDAIGEIFRKKLGARLGEIDGGRRTLEAVLAAKVKVPKAMIPEKTEEPAVLPAEDAAEIIAKDIGEHLEEDEAVEEIPLDPSKIQGLVEGDLTESDLEDGEGDDTLDEDFEEDEEDGEEEDEEDEPGLRRIRRKSDEDADCEGRAEAWREMAAMGWGEEDA